MERLIPEHAGKATPLPLFRQYLSTEVYLRAASAQGHGG